MAKTKIKAPPLDQTEGRKEGSQARKLNHPDIQEEPSHTVEDSGMQQDQEFITRDNDEQPADKEVTKADWFKKPERPPAPNPDWNQYMRKRLMRVDELHKFSDGTLNDVWSALYDIVTGIRMEYLPMRKGSNLYKKRAQVMVQDINKQLYQRRLLWNLENFVGGREYENDLGLLERTI
nr:hypothetical protein [Tanacetum cinerariifolium]